MSRISVNGLELNVVIEGDGQPVLLLHGFPDSAALWRYVGPRLVGAGYRTIALDQRGFGESDAPPDRKSYALTHMEDDALAVLDSLGIEQAHLVGHDWGASVGWLLAGKHPDRFVSFAALSLGHSQAYAAAGLEQWKKAWYILVALVPGVGEWLVRRDGWSLFRSTVQHSEADHWVEELSRSGRLTAALNWYRANSVAPERHPNLRIPVLGVWSDRDVVLTEAQMTGSAKFVDGPWRFERIEGASHWIPLDVPEQLSALLVSFFQSAPPGQGEVMR